jgi:hypothetical protein
VHRGMFHSIPAVLIAGELAFLMASGDSVTLRWYKAGGVMLGYLSHLLLDEFYSVEALRLRVKQSFGTALKLFDRKHLWPNVSTYIKLAILSYIVFYEPTWTADYRQQMAEWRDSKVVQEVLRGRGLDKFLSADGTSSAAAPAAAPLQGPAPALPLVPIDRSNAGRDPSALWR